MVLCCVISNYWRSHCLISGKPYDQHRNTSWTAAAYCNNTRSVWRISPSFIPLENLRKHTGITIFCFHSCSRCLIFLLSIIFHKLYRLRILIQKFNDLLRISCRNCFLSYPCNSLLCRLCLLSRIWCILIICLLFHSFTVRLYPILNRCLCCIRFSAGLRCLCLYISLSCHIIRL